MPTLNWSGKDKIVNYDSAVPVHVLNHSYNFGGDTENKIIHGDNLLALKSLLPVYESRVKCIYIDPPYNTGNEGWIYNDNVNDPRFKKWLGQVVGREGEDFSRHDKWLCMMYPRLKLLKRLLADDGAIFISIDDNEQANLKLICDEIFGHQNFCSNMIWKSKSGGANDVNGIACDTENIFVYAKNISSCKFNYDKGAKVSTSYNRVDSDGRRYSLERLDKQSLGYQESLDFPIIGTDGKIYTVEHKNPKVKRARWRWSKETVLERYNELVFNYPYVYTKNYEKEGGVIPRNLLVDERFGRTRTGKTELASYFDNVSPFSFPKPTKLIQYLVDMATNKNSIVLDSFAGSGTTAHAVLNLNKADGGNRKFILVEMEDYAETITAERVKRVIDGYGKVEGTGGSFDFYEIGEQIFIDDELNENLDIEKIRAYVWQVDTRTKYVKPSGDCEEFLGVDDGTAYYYYEGILDRNFLATIKTRANEYIIYAESCA
ncbi:MAG: site-specific DNA-methyltransferase, partial [Selenomonadaceae bacterium]|nr:site-specific DNA-methyltransferase [Selenomonadaceae bacterium]